MLKRFRIDPLFLFLMLGAVFLWLTFPSIHTGIYKGKQYVISNMNIEEQLVHPVQGNASEGIIKVFNEDLTLLYSLDGGVHFYTAENNEIDLSTIDNPEILYRQTSLRWKDPKGKFPIVKSVIVKLRNENKLLESPPKVLTFFEQKEKDFPTLSIVINEKDLLSWEKGIMVMGQSSSVDSGFYRDWWYRTANYVNKGYKWGRGVTLQYFDQKQLQFTQICEMRISGNATRHFPQKSLKFFPKNSQGKETKLEFPLFGKEGNKKTESLLLRQSGNDNNRTLFADLLMHQLADGGNVLVLKGFPTRVFINGNYWGIYNLRERIDTYWISKKENGKKKDITILTCEGIGYRSILKKGKQKEKDRFDQMIAELPSFLEDEKYNLLKEKIDIASFTDYILFESFFANQDWLYNNIIWFKEKGEKWKWIMNDLDCGLSYQGSENKQVNIFDKLKEDDSIVSKLFQALISNAEFKEAFKKRGKEILEQHFSDLKIKNTYSNLKNLYDQEIDLQINRWRFIKSKDSWENNCENNVSFIRDRRAIFLKQITAL